MCTHSSVKLSETWDCMPLHAAKQTGITTIPQEASYHIWQPKKEAETLPQDGGRQERMKVTRAGERLSMDARVHLTPHTHSHKHTQICIMADHVSVKWMAVPQPSRGKHLEEITGEPVIANTHRTSSPLTDTKQPTPTTAA